jgi:hypothetical protein
MQLAILRKTFRSLNRDRNGFPFTSRKLDWRRRFPFLFGFLIATIFLLIAQNTQAWHFGGVVWFDNNRDGIRETGEAGVAGVTVQVRKCSDNSLVTSAVTASDGSFTFYDTVVPQPGTYHVDFTNLPGGFVFSPQIYPPPTNGTVVSTANPLTGYAPCFTFDQLANFTLNNAGIYQSVTPLCPSCAVEYPYASTNPLTSVAFNESEIMTAFSTNLLGVNDTIKVWYNDERALTLGIRQVAVKTGSGWTTNKYPVSPLMGNPGGATNPAVGTTLTSGNQAGVDLAGRPMFPALYFSDTTMNSANRSGDWQFGGTAIPPHAVFGTWKAATKVVDNTKTPAQITVTPDGDPTKNNWSLGAGDPAPAGCTNLGYGAEVRWNVGSLGLIPGHSYRLYFMIHDGDQNRSGGDAGQACINLCVASNTVAGVLTSLGVCAGNSAMFSTIASGTGPFSYVWKKNGVVLTGQTNNTYSIASVGAADAGTYSVIVKGAVDSVTNNATLSINPATTATALSSLMKCAGGSASFTTAASGTGPFNYAWRKNGTLLVGQTTNSIIIPTVTPSDSGTYSVEVTGSCNTVTNSATLTVNANTTASPLTSLIKCPGDGATFTTLASGTGPFSYLWRKDGVQLPGHTNTLSIASVGAADAGTYSVEVSGSCNTVTNSAALTVNSVTTATPLTSQVHCVGDTLDFTTTPSGTGPFVYVWRKDGAMLASRTNTLFIPSVSTTNAGLYTVEVSGACNAVTHSAILTVNTPATIFPLANLVRCPGDTATFSIAASGTGPFAYLWRKDGLPLAGQTTNNLIIATVSSADTGFYSVEVTGACNTVTNGAALTINSNTVATPLSSLVHCAGDSAIFTTLASGTGPFNYIWRKNGVLVPGQTTNTLAITSVASTDAGTYSVEVGGGCNTVTNSATLTINSSTLASALASQVHCIGDTAVFGTIASGTGPFIYVWKKDGVVLAGQSGNSISIAPIGAGDAGLYSVEVTGSCNTVTNSASLIVNPAITATPLINWTACPGDNVVFTTLASGAGPFNFVWRKDGIMQFGGLTNTLTIPNITSANAGIYSIEISGACGSVTNSATLIVNTNVSATPLTSLVRCPGDGATFSTMASGTGPIHYLWRKDGILLTDQTAGSITINPATATDAGTYTVEVSGSCTTVTNSAVLIVNSSTIATAPLSLVKNSGDSATFSTVASGTGPFTYVWRKDGNLLAGRTGSSFTIPSVAATNAGRFSVEVTGTCNTVTNQATLTLNLPPTVSILSPTNGSVFVALANMTVLADAHDTDGTISKVEFFLGGTNRLGESLLEPYYTLWTNVPPGNYQLKARATDNLGATGISDPVNVTVVDQPPIATTGPVKFNQQTGLFEQPMRVTNPTYYTYDGVRVSVRNLAPGVQVYNATGMTNGVPFIQAITPVVPGASVDFVIEYYIPTRILPSPAFTVELVAPLNALHEAGPSQHLDRGLILPNKNFLVEFNTRSNRVYYVQYGTNFFDWKTVTPAIVGTGSRIQWIDNGQPKTDASPATRTSRFYRVILLP